MVTFLIQTEKGRHVPKKHVENANQNVFVMNCDVSFTKK